MAYPNGRLPAELLGRIPGVGILFPLAFIDQVVALMAAFEKHFGKPLKITDGYRPYSGTPYAQVEIMLARYKPLAEFRRIAPGVSVIGRKYHVWNGERRYLLPGQPQTAYPGTSNHGRGDYPALDLGSGANIMDSPEHKWVVLNAPRFGFRWPAEWARASREPWHIDATGVVEVAHRINVSTGVTIPTIPGVLPTPLEEDQLDTRQAAQLAAADENAAEARRVAGEALAVVREVNTRVARLQEGLDAIYLQARDANTNAAAVRLDEAIREQNLREILANLPDETADSVLAELAARTGRKVV